MSILHSMATMFAKEMIEHDLKCGATVLNTKYISDVACDLTYQIDKSIRSYEGYDESQHGVTMQGLDNLIAKHMETAHAMMHAQQQYRQQHQPS